MFLYGTRVVSTIVDLLFTESFKNYVGKKGWVLFGGPQSADFYKRLWLKVRQSQNKIICFRDLLTFRNVKVVYALPTLSRYSKRLGYCQRSFWTPLIMMGGIGVLTVGLLANGDWRRMQWPVLILFLNAYHVMFGLISSTYLLILFFLSHTTTIEPLLFSYLIR